MVAGVTFRDREGLGLAAIVLIGLTLSLLPVYHAAMKRHTGAEILIGILPPFLLGVGIIAAGVLGYTREFEGDLWGVILWTAAGALFLGAGAYLWIAYQAVSGVVLRDSVFMVTNAATGGAVLGLLVGFYDYGTRVKQRQLLDERQRLQALFRNVGGPAVLLGMEDDALLVREVNPVFEEVFGLSAEDAEGRRLSDVLMTPEGSTVESIRAAARQGRRDVEEVEVSTPTGRRYFLVQVAPFRTEESAGAYLNYIDVTERKFRQQQVDVLNRVLRHDLRNRINVILGYAELLEGSLSGDDLRKARGIEREAQELVGVSDMVQKFESRSGETHPVDIAEMIRGGVESVRKKHPGLEVETGLPDELWVSGSGLLEVVLDVFLENAVVHNDLPERESTVSVSAFEEDGRAIVEVEDNGPGIPEEELEVLESGRETSMYHSEGVGLWVSKWVVNRIGGELEFERLEPRGTRVRIALNRTEEPGDTGG